MSRPTIPTSMVLPLPEHHYPGEILRASEYKVIGDALNYHYSRVGAVLPGLVFDDPFQMTATSYGVDNTNGDVDLDTWAGIWKFKRPVINASGDTVYSMQFDAFLQNCTLRFSWFRFDGEGDTSGAVASGSVELTTTSGDSEWVRQTVEFTEAEAYESGSTSNDLALFYVYVQAKVPSSGTANIWHLGALEERISADELPGELESGEFVPFGLTQDQFENQSLQLALRAKADQVWKQTAGSAEDREGPSEVTIADNDEIAKWIDAGPDGVHVDTKLASDSPVWDATPASTGASHVVKTHSTSTARYFVLPDSQQFLDFLHDNTTDYVVIWRGSINADISSERGTFLSSRSSGAGDGAIMVYGSSANVIRWGVHANSGAATLDYTWSGFTQDQVYTIVIQHTQGGNTTMSIDGTQVASTDLTANMAAGDASSEFAIGSRVGVEGSATEHEGLVICKGSLTSTEITAFEDWIKAGQS